MSTEKLVCKKCRHPLLADEKVLVSLKSSLRESYHNHDPSPLEKNLLRATLMDVATERLRLDSGVVRATLLLEQLRLQRNRVETYIAEHESVFTPIRRLPAGIMAEVFILCPPDPHNLEANDNVRQTLSLSQVNKKWRDIAISTPQLWSRIVIRGNDIQHSPNWLSNLVKTTKIWLERSQRSPLHLHINLWADCVPFLEALIPHSNRWESVRLSLRPLMYSVLAPIRGHLLSLVSLVIIYVGAGRVEVDTPTSKTYELAPQLRRVRVSGISLFTALPWSQLTEWIGGEAVSDCVTVLERAINLSTCCFTLQSFASVICPPPLPPNNHLTTMNITLYDVDITSSFFNLLTLPVLRRFSLKVMDDRPINELPSFLSRSPLLESLHISLCEFPYGVLTDCLPHAPSVVKLTLTNRWFASIRETADLMRELVYDRPIGALGLLPRLRALCFNNISRTSIPPLVDMVSSRIDRPVNGEPSRLDSLHLVYKIDTEIDPAVPEALKPFEEMGLGVYIDSMAPLDLDTASDSSSVM